MGWTATRYADTPSLEIAIWVDAPPERVWSEISDIEAMASISTELQRVEWLDGATGPAEGALFVGYNSHPLVGEWQTTSRIIAYARPEVIAWDVIGDNQVPATRWRFTLEPSEGGTSLRQWVQVGPGTGGLSATIEQEPDKEEEVMSYRLREIEGGMNSTLAEVKRRSEK
ncbi:SRPBCC family protein [Amycolatopsis pigmentata]|uniref:SRPBCC family protein n=1 Tax=Amycolatopsis pigmentata TaxID=450801 RepID=A0ABW5G602_9PSEU